MHYKDEMSKDQSIAQIIYDTEGNTMSKYEAVDRLLEIQEELSALGNEARNLMREHFPGLAEQGDAYGAFTFGKSWNRYDTTLETLIEETEDYEEEEY